MRGFITVNAMARTRAAVLFSVAFLHSPAPLQADLDLDGDGLSDIWELQYEAQSVLPEDDNDFDGSNNLSESAAGTNPFDILDRPGLDLYSVAPGHLELSWFGLPGKTYDLLTKPDLGTGKWTVAFQTAGAGDVLSYLADTGGPSTFFRLAISDTDSDGDGLNDWEENQAGFNPFDSHTDRYLESDYDRAMEALGAANLVELVALDTDTHENWPEPALFAIVREGGIDPLDLTVKIEGSARQDLDYAFDPPPPWQLQTGQRFLPIEVTPLQDTAAEGPETVHLALSSVSTYWIGSKNQATVSIGDAQAPGHGISRKEAVRFLRQASFGATPETIALVQSLGFEGWIDQQMDLLPSLHLPLLAEIAAELPPPEEGEDDRAPPVIKSWIWWEHAITAPDTLRQRVAFALSEILVISQFSNLYNYPDGMLDFYDLLVQNAFGKYRDLLYEVSLHPAMGIYLSHLRNAKADPVEGTFPDENYAREIMQLFSIGLWELNPDGTPVLVDGEPIPTYDNADITEMARVFTGLSFAGTDTSKWYTFWFGDPVMTEPMAMWPLYHDEGSKTLVDGTVLPAFADDPGRTGFDDVAEAIDVLANHDNTGPFIAFRMIQRLVTSNPSPAYVARVSAVWDDDGEGRRGELGAVIKAILLDPEARDFSYTQVAEHGKQQEPLIRLAELMRAFGAASPSGRYPLMYLYDLFGQEAHSSPSVFNFFLPDYHPAGPLGEAGLYGPEFQITNAVTAVSFPNLLLWTLYGGFWGAEDFPQHKVEYDLADMAVLTIDPAAAVKHLDETLYGGTMSAENFRILVEALERLRFESPRWRAVAAIYLAVTAPEFSALK